MDWAKDPLPGHAFLRKNSSGNRKICRNFLLNKKSRPFRRPCCKRDGITFPAVPPWFLRYNRRHSNLCNVQLTSPSTPHKEFQKRSSRGKFNCRLNWRRLSAGGLLSLTENDTLLCTVIAFYIPDIYTRISLYILTQLFCLSRFSHSFSPGFSSVFSVSVLSLRPI